MALSRPLNHDSSTEIFKLNVDCFDEIFEYLSLQDLHSVGETCKVLQKVAGEYFLHNYQAAEKFIGSNGIYTVASDNENDTITTSAFNQYSEFVSVPNEYGIQSLHNVEHSDKLKSIKHLYLAFFQLNILKSINYRKILSKIEILQIRACSIWRDDFYEFILIECPMLKRLYVQGDLKLQNQNWLLQNYPVLEHLELTPFIDFKINELVTFFDSNQQLRSFCTSTHCLWANKNDLLKINIKLNELEIKDIDPYGGRIQVGSLEELCSLLNQLYERGFYKKLHFYVHDLNEAIYIQFSMLKGLEKLSIGHSLTYSSIQLNDLRELAIFDSSSANGANNMDNLANNHVNLERILLQNASFEDILPFIRRSSKLTKLKICVKSEADTINAGITNLIKLNKEREQLAGARKLTIFVADNIFLATKWATPNGIMDLNLIEMRRSKSYRWDYDYSTVRRIE